MYFFFKQKTAYEIRISDWSSDVCSSDLIFTETDRAIPFKQFELKSADVEIPHDTGISEEPAEQRQAQPKPLGLPLIGGPPNDLTRAQRLIAIGKIDLFLTIIIIAVILLFAAALDALST